VCVDASGIKIIIIIITADSLVCSIERSYFPSFVSSARVFRLAEAAPNGDVAVLPLHYKSSLVNCCGVLASRAKPIHNETAENRITSDKWSWSYGKTKYWRAYPRRAKRKSQPPIASSEFFSNSINQ